MKPTGLVAGIVAPRASSFFAGFQEAIFVYKPVGAYSHVIKPPTLTSHTIFGYSIIDPVKNVKKKGGTANGVLRQQLSIEKGIMEKGDRMVQTYNLDFVSPEIEAKLMAEYNV